MSESVRSRYSIRHSILLRVIPTELGFLWCCFTLLQGMLLYRIKAAPSRAPLALSWGLARQLEALSPVPYELRVPSLF